LPFNRQWPKEEKKPLSTEIKSERNSQNFAVGRQTGASIQPKVRILAQIGLTDERRRIQERVN